MPICNSFHSPRLTKYLSKTRENAYLGSWFPHCGKKAPLPYHHSVGLHFLTIIQQSSLLSVSINKTMTKKQHMNKRAYFTYGIIYHWKKSQEIKAGTGTEIMLDSYLLACFFWLSQLLILYSRAPLPNNTPALSKLSLFPQLSLSKRTADVPTGQSCGGSSVPHL